MVGDIQRSTAYITAPERRRRGRGITAFDVRSVRAWQQPLQTAFRVPRLLLAAPTRCCAAGINVGPLVASVGGIGVVLGLASQRVMATTFAAITLVRLCPCCACTHARTHACAG